MSEREQKRIAVIVPPGAFKSGGVADYGRVLRAALESLGVIVAEFELSGVPGTAGLDEDLKRIRSWNPDAINLPFVPYTYHPKGLVGGWAGFLKQLRGPWKVSWMFHELWIGESTEYGLKDRLVGYLQMRGIRRILNALPPNVVHTTNPSYQHMLARIGFESTLLPLFGNIPVTSDSREPSLLEKELESRGLGRSRTLCVGFFGAIYQPWVPDAFAVNLASEADRLGLKPVICSIGRKGRWADARWDAWTRAFPHIVLIRLDEQPAEQISQVLQDLDAGLNTTPWALINKSGSAAAMREHGLPVIILRDDFRLRKGATPQPIVDEGFHRWHSEANPAWWQDALRRVPPGRRSPQRVAEQLLHDLGSMHRKHANGL